MRRAFYLRAVRRLFPWCSNERSVMAAKLEKTNTPVSTDGT